LRGSSFTHLFLQNEEIKECKQPYTLLSPHTCDITVELSSHAKQDASMKSIFVEDKLMAATPLQPAQREGMIASSIHS
jgi:hypothetical protein